MGQRPTIMLKAFVFSLFILFVLFLSSRPQVFAETKLAAPSATLDVPVTPEGDHRAEVLQAFLIKQNSPFSDKTQIFVQEADRQNLDWRLLVAISGVESTFGLRYPVGTYNAWGWGIYGSNMHGFLSWDEAIQTISKELRERYIDQWGAKDIYQIGNFYAESPTWASRVTSFMDAIASFEKEYTSAKLPISL